MQRSAIRVLYWASFQSSICPTTENFTNSVTLPPRYTSRRQDVLANRRYCPCPFGAQQLFQCAEAPDFTFGVELCEDVWVADTPSVAMARMGATLIVNLSCSDEIIGKAAYRRTILQAKSGSLLCAYAYADAGMGESTQDMVFAGHNLDFRKQCDFGRIQAIFRWFALCRTGLTANGSRTAAFQLVPAVAADNGLHKIFHAADRNCPASLFSLQHRLCLPEQQNFLNAAKPS